MRRGTTPTIIYTLPEEVSVAEVAEARITIRQNERMIVDRSLSDMIVDSANNTLGLLLTQEEALRLIPHRNAELQLKVKLIGGNVLATSVRRLPVLDILNEEVI